MRYIKLFLSIITICSYSYAYSDVKVDEGSVSKEDKIKTEKALSKLVDELITSGQINPSSMCGTLKNYLNENPNIYGAAFAFVPQERDGKQFKSAPYVYRDGTIFKEKSLETNYDYTKEKWYSEPVKLRKQVWSEPYYDVNGAGADVLLTTYSIPVYTTDKPPVLIGVATSDILIRKDK